jgi:TM2 domain-containing membrane protein YozV
MKQIKRLSILALGLLFVSTSCSVEKRVHTAGYHIDWNSNNDRLHQKDVLIRDKDKGLNTFGMAEDVIAFEVKSSSFDGKTAFAKSNDFSNKTSVQEIFTTKSSSFRKKEKAISAQNIEALKEQTTSFIQENQSDKIADAAEEEVSAANTKSQLIALLLVIFVGTLGIHRFYLGYTTIGIIQLLTGGGCGIWALIDLIRIITGDLKPKGGRYNPKL